MAAWTEPSSSETKESEFEDVEDDSVKVKKEKKLSKFALYTLDLPSPEAKRGLGIEQHPIV